MLGKSTLPSNFHLGDRVVVSNPTPADEQHPGSRSPMWEGQKGTVTGFQGSGPGSWGVKVRMDRYPARWSNSPLLFIDHELSATGLTNILNAWEKYLNTNAS